MDGTILVADDDRAIRTVLTQALTRAGCKVHATSSLVTLLRWVEEGKGDLIISDVMMPDGNGIEMMPQIAELRPGLPVIVISAQNTIMTTIQATEADAFEYLPKPFDLPELMKKCAKALEVKRRVGMTVAAKSIKIDRAEHELPFVGKTAEMQNLYRLIAKVLHADFPVMIMGESGTGKSLVAKALHDFSDRCSKPFIIASFNDLSTEDKMKALVARADGGTILFDEVCEFDDTAQYQLVRLLDDLGENQPRILTTSQVNLSKKLEEGVFRQDLYYRLSGVLIKVPPLRDRVEDIQLLCEHFLQKLHNQGHELRYLADDAIELIRTYSWPGNVRQLEHLIARLVVTSHESKISLTEVDQAFQNQPDVEPLFNSGSDDKISSSIAKHLRRYFDLHGDALPPTGLYQRVLKELETPLIEISLDAVGGNQAKCADLLGINRNTLRKKISELDIKITKKRTVV